MKKIGGMRIWEGEDLCVRMGQITDFGKGGFAQLKEEKCAKAEDWGGMYTISKNEAYQKCKLC